MPSSRHPENPEAEILTASIFAFKLEKVCVCVPWIFPPIGALTIGMRFWGIEVYTTVCHSKEPKESNYYVLKFLYSAFLQQRVVSQAQLVAQPDDDRPRGKLS